LLCQGGQSVKVGKHVFKLLLMIFIMLYITSCSYLSGRAFIDEGANSDQDSSAKKMVTQAQYDELMKKYETLQNELHANKSEKIVSAEEQKKSESTVVDSIDLADQINSLQIEASVVNALDEQKKEEKEQAELPPSSSLTSKEIVREITMLSNAIDLLAKGEVSQALPVLKELENSSDRQIKARAKFYLGELLFLQQEFELAKQMFEQIIERHAYSSVVLKALGRLIVCCERLNLSHEKDKYYSILHDFFEAV